MKSLEKCILILQEDLDIHVGWKQWNIDHAEHIKTCGICQETQRTAGDEAHHDEWIEKYSMIIKTLKEICETNSI
jgi:hypothetical protein